LSNKFEPRKISAMSKPKQHFRGRRLNTASLSISFTVWVVAVSFLSIERQLRHDVHAKWMIGVRQAVNTCFGSDDAFANIEHLLFGLVTATLAIMLVSMAQDSSQFAPTTSPPRWKAAVRRAAAATYRILRSTMSSGLWRLCPANANTLVRTGTIFRILTAVVIPGLVLPLAWKSWAYGRADMAVIGIVVLLTAGAAWRPRTTLALVNTRPALMASSVSLPVWLHFEGVWKFERVGHHLNTLAHAARHGTLSAGACCAALLAFHLFASGPNIAVRERVSYKQDA
jgi:hypothetical protein